MKAHYRTANGRVTFEVESQTVREIFGQVADLQQIFEAETRCGCCGGNEIRMLHRTVAKGKQAFEYYQLQCAKRGCGATFSFGQLTVGGGLFPKRKDKDGNWLPNGGWSKYSAGSQGSEDDPGSYEGDYSQEPPPAQQQALAPRQPPPAGTRHQTPPGERW